MYRLLRKMTKFLDIFEQSRAPNKERIFQFSQCHRLFGNSQYVGSQTLTVLIYQLLMNSAISAELLGLLHIHDFFSHFLFHLMNCMLVSLTR